MNSTRKQNAALSFDRAARLYDTAAGVQHAVGHRLAERIERLDLPVRPMVLEIGCGTGLFTRAALGRVEPSLWLATDISPAMVIHGRERFRFHERVLFACMDGEAPAAVPGFDLVCANLAVQWFDDLAGALERLVRLIRAGGWLAFTTLAAGTFAEWVDIHRRLGLVAGTPAYPDQAGLARQLPPGGWGNVTEEVLSHVYPDAHAFVAALKTIGAHTTDRPPLAPGAFRQVLRSFGVGRPVTVSYHIAYGLWRKQSNGER
ncbi:MAG: Biotin synthesis protein bioC / Dethiobiotin synthetase [Rhodospirillaceae bacterium]|nr:MAG: Biotin synthesis protein bioC / Dethiobiotin synthetase [Rhodospirillaceae bacterium]